MTGKIAALTAVPLILFSISCAQPEPEPEVAEPSAEEVAEVVDPTVADAAHYTTEFENDRVRILRIAYGPGEASVMHHHPDGVAVWLTDQSVQMTMPDGSAEELPASAGDAMFVPGGDHLPENLTDEPLELILVELKGGESAGVSDGPDATVVDADHYETEIENDRVRVLRVNYGPGEESAMHYHPDNVAVFLTDVSAEMTLPDGTTQQLEASAGDAMFAPAEQHLPKNLSDGPIEVVLIELK